MKLTRRASPNLPTALTLFVAACTAPGLDTFTSYDEPAPEPASTTSATGGTTIEPKPTTSEGQAPGSTTTAIGSTSGSGRPDDPRPVPPPLIVTHALGPDPLEQPGPVAALITTAHADGVRMQVDDAAPVELSLANPDAFAGEIAPFTALDNGDHAATFVAWRDMLESAPLVVPFTVALPASGSELFWHSDSALGKGSIVALAVTPDQTLIELGTRQVMGQPRCYLRRRDLGGAWTPTDVIDVAPDTSCSAIDLIVDAAGALHVLADIFENGEIHWWLGKFEAWAGPVTHIGAGAPGETAHALAGAPNRVAVCGTKPHVSDFDAAVWIFSPNQPGKNLSFDYVPANKTQHEFSENPADCAFSATRLVLGGGVHGPHDINEDDRIRHFILEVDTLEEQWTVAEPGLLTQSAAHTITIDAQGRYITGGYSCDDTCAEQIGELRMFMPGATQLWHRPLLPEVAAPRDIAWSPAEYIAFVSAQALGPNDTAFFAQAYIPLHAVPLWSYDHHDAPDFQSAVAMAIGPYNQIYAGGAGAGGYPALAIIAP